MLAFPSDAGSKGLNALYLDFFPNMPPYLEIEGNSETHIAEALRLLGLEHHKTSADGERVVAQSYGCDWYDMRFNHKA